MILISSTHDPKRPAIGLVVLACWILLGAVASADSTIIQVPVSSASDDAEETQTGNVSLASQDLELAYDLDSQTVGLRFQSVAIPQGALILNAFVQFQVDESSGGAVSLTLAGQASANPATFTSTFFDISSRPRTVSEIAWSPAPWNPPGLRGPDQRTPNLAPVVQEIVDLPAWIAGNALALTIRGQGTGKRVAEAFEGDFAPLLQVEYLDTAPAGTLERRVSARSDDAEERSNGSVNLSSPDLELVQDGSWVQTVGMRFNNVTIPPGATISHAYVQFQVDESANEPTSLVIAGEATAQALTFDSALGSISSRPKTSESVTWYPLPWPTLGLAGPDQRTPDIAPIIDAIVGRSDWANGNSIAIIINGTGKRTAESFDGDPSGGPLLHIDYALDPGDRPPTISDIPDQASMENRPTRAISFTVGDAETPPRNLLVSASSDDVSLVPDGNFLFRGAGANRSLTIHPATDMTGNTAITVTVADASGLVAMDSFLLTVHPTGSVMTADSRVSARSDDAEERRRGTVNLTSHDLELVFDASVNQTVGIRFNDVTIPPGATIIDAYVQFQADETDAAPTALTIQGEEVNDAATFTRARSDISSRSRTSESVSWSPRRWGVVGQAGPGQRTPNLASILEAIVQRSGWSNGNSIVLIIAGTGRRTAESYDGDPSGAPRLHIDFIP